MTRDSIDSVYLDDKSDLLESYNVLVDDNTVKLIRCRVLSYGLHTQLAHKIR
jgi:hypothetical protein